MQADFVSASFHFIKNHKSRIAQEYKIPIDWQILLGKCVFILIQDKITHFSDP